MLQKLKTQNYRNIHIFNDMFLDKLNIFIGSNGSGKTNLIDLITFIRDALTLPDSEAMGISKLDKAYFRSRKDFLDKWMRQDKRGMIRFEFYFDYPELHDRFSSEPKKLLLLSLVLFIDTKGNPHLSYESLASISENLLLTDQHFFYYQCFDHYNDLQNPPDKEGEVFVFTDNQKKNLEPVNISKIPSDRLLLESITSVLETTDIAPSKALPTGQWSSEEQACELQAQVAWPESAPPWCWLFRPPLRFASCRWAFGQRSLAGRPEWKPGFQRQHSR